MPIGRLVLMIVGLHMALFFSMVLIKSCSAPKEQATLSRSSSEAEYRALANAITEIMRVKSLLLELQLNLLLLHSGVTIKVPCFCYQPYTSCSYKAWRAGQPFVRKKVVYGQVLVHYVPSIEQIAYKLTKPLFISQFCFLCNKLNVIVMPLSLPRVLRIQVELRC